MAVRLQPSALQQGAALEVVSPSKRCNLVLRHIKCARATQDFRKPGSQAETGSFFGFEGAFKGTDNGYPGGPFDPLNLAG
jgi:hypothetical protein